MCKFKKLFLSKEVGIVLVLMSFAVLPLQGYADSLIVGLASKSEVKREAVKEMFQTLYPESTLDLVEYAAESEIAEQPVGEKNGILGAKNRLKNARKSSSVKVFDYWISIENYIEPTHEGSWVDRAVVITQRNGKPAVTELSREIHFEAEFGEEAGRKTPKDYRYVDTGFSVTAGKIIQMKFLKEGQQVANNDWQSRYGGVSRKELIKEALFKALVRSQIDTVVDFKKKGVQFMELSDVPEAQGSL